jgi:hypothetical protein
MTFLEISYKNAIELFRAQKRKCSITVPDFTFFFFCFCLGLGFFQPYHHLPACLWFSAKLSENQEPPAVKRQPLDSEGSFLGGALANLRLTSKVSPPFKPSISLST